MHLNHVFSLATMPPRVKYDVQVCSAHGFQGYRIPSSRISDSAANEKVDICKVRSGRQSSTCKPRSQPLLSCYQSGFAISKNLKWDTEPRIWNCRIYFDALQTYMAVIHVGHSSGKSNCRILCRLSLELETRLFGAASECYEVARFGKTDTVRGYGILVFKSV
ncbi:uncharacterized protein EAF01_006345 [Botrytis porri]|uniref:uncharacterized protein n=1 Tax=Botrytis porri TaxID=87229 RepID=UPI001900E11F|nr:uncharacterized protein EAF01_006345 [Botrytis porri]KAF7903296.1 hypothetical protein EAF01_006345 [Botrytis porri]